MITVDLSDKEARIFRALAEANALDVVKGRVTIHFDSEGNAAQVEVVRFTTLSTPKLLTPFDETITVSYDS